MDNATAQMIGRAYMAMMTARREMRKHRCTEASRGNDAEPPVLPCRFSMNTVVDTWCPACQERDRWHTGYQIARSSLGDWRRKAYREMAKQQGIEGDDHE